MVEQPSGSTLFLHVANTSGVKNGLLDGAY